MIHLPAGAPRCSRPSGTGATDDGAETSRWPPGRLAPHEGSRRLLVDERDGLHPRQPRRLRRVARRLWRDGWGYDDVLPYFKKAEGNTRLGDPYHGTDGPLNVEDRRYTHELSHAFVESAVAAGFKRNDDFNGAEQEGAGPLPGHLQEGPPVVRCRRLHPSGQHAIQLHRAHRSIRDEDRHGGQPRNRSYLSARWRHPDDAGQRRGRAVRRRRSPARSC